MLESAISYQRAFYSLSLCDPNYKLSPSIIEYKRAEVMCEFFLTNLIFGSPNIKFVYKVNMEDKMSFEVKFD